MKLVARLVNITLIARLFILYCLVFWNMSLMIWYIWYIWKWSVNWWFGTCNINGLWLPIRNVMIPIHELHHFSEGLNQPVYIYIHMVKISKVIGLYKPIHHCRGDHLQIFRFDLPETGPSRFFVTDCLSSPGQLVNEATPTTNWLPRISASTSWLLTGWWFGPFLIFPNSWDDDII